MRGQTKAGMAAALAFGIFLSRAGRSLGDEPSSAPTPAARIEQEKLGRTLFLKNCAHCHGDDARGDEGPDLHGLDHTDAWIGRRIRNGMKGEMTAFGEKFNSREVDAIIGYLRTLK